VGVSHGGKKDDAELVRQLQDATADMVASGEMAKSSPGTVWPS